MLLDDLQVSADAFTERTGWEIKPEGACKGDVCVPLPDDPRRPGGMVDVAAVAQRLGMPIVTDATHGVSALGPETATGSKVLAGPTAPDVVLPDADGNPFRLSSLHGQKVLLVAWASW